MRSGGGLARRVHPPRPPPPVEPAPPNAASPKGKPQMDDLDAPGTVALPTALATTWPMTTPIRLMPLTAGRNNLVYHVEASASLPCILRVYRNHADVARVRYEVALLAALRDTPLPFAVPTPLATRA